MRIRNTHDIPHPTPSSSESPHTMTSRINFRVNKTDSTSRSSFNQEQDREIGYEGEEAMYVAPASQSLIVGWREEEKTMPLKKRRFLSFERSDDIDGRGKMVKVEGDEEEERSMRCGRTDGKKWRCSGRRVEGYSMCEHHLLIRRLGYRRENLTKREIGEGEGDLDDEKKKKKKKKKRAKAEEERFGNDNNTNKKKKVKKARSINSLVRDTVPFYASLNL